MGLSPNDEHRPGVDEALNDCPSPGRDSTGDLMRQDSQPPPPKNKHERLPPLRRLYSIERALVALYAALPARQATILTSLPI
ncbi:uncharacterized protein UV8b_03994 [Ustilaginoidea virens]|uniref:Uncharacterized protein n=1 Tax=Ustilaginoidea virens TaxID=1159556 RepID=A0A8E5HQS5_USTVR|nr:uncharacterized protein UV8b_03994 [Ustilaginoidea virens]QUC19753.1 hypothetical protein UV8b_03994 [Ustilaginoidea virens]